MVIDFETRFKNQTERTLHQQGTQLQKVEHKAGLIEKSVEQLKEVKVEVKGKVSGDDFSKLRFEVSNCVTKEQIKIIEATLQFKADEKLVSSLIQQLQNQGKISDQLLKHSQEQDTLMLKCEEDMRNNFKMINKIKAEADEVTKLNRQHSNQLSDRLAEFIEQSAKVRAQDLLEIDLKLERLTPLEST